MVNENAALPFSKTRLEKLAAPQVGRDTYRDTACPNLILRVTGGSRTFCFYGRIAGSPTKLVLGKFPAMTVQQAQAACRRMAGAKAEGRDPAAERRARRQEATLGVLWQAYLELHAKPRKRSWRDDQRQYEKYMVPLAAKKLSLISKAVVAKWHGQLAKDHGPIQANRSKALLATMFSKASAAVGYNGVNPVVGVANFPERSRERFLLPGEMKAFFTALAAEEEIWRHFFLMALFTGSRRGNVASMRWEEIDLANGVWHIPATKTKNKRPAALPLSPPALEILRQRQQQANGGEYVFPSSRTDRHIVEPKTAWKRILAGMRTCPNCHEVVGAKPNACPACRQPLPKAKPLDLRMHDLRRSMGSWQAALGASLVVIGKSLGHADLKSTQVYSRLQLDPVRESVSKAASAMIVAGGVNVLTVEPVANVEKCDDEKA